MVTDKAQCRTSSKPPSLGWTVLQSKCYFLGCNLNLAVCAQSIWRLLRLRRPSFNSDISQRSKRTNRYGLSSPRFRHRFSPGPDRSIEPAHQRTYRAFQDAQKGQPFPARPAEDGLAASQLARLFETHRHSALPRRSWKAGIATIANEIRSNYSRESSNL